MNEKLVKEFVRGLFAVIVAIITTFGGSYFGLYQPKITELENQCQAP